mmetsp:Transcript_9996/g.28801  ORF Transcript_9996/g.28801 Transcript_9996/m.28801 type:complete len:233 (+) Transcript_9996:835-1533(+)
MLGNDSSTYPACSARKEETFSPTLNSFKSSLPSRTCFSSHHHNSLIATPSIKCASRMPSNSVSFFIALAIGIGLTPNLIWFVDSLIPLLLSLLAIFAGRSTPFLSSAALMPFIASSYVFTETLFSSIQIFKPLSAIPLKHSPTSSYGITSTPESFKCFATSSFTLSLSTNRNASFSVTNTCDKQTGLHSASPPLTFINHMTSSKAETTKQSCFSFSIAFLTPVNFSFVDFPA